MIRMARPMMTKVFAHLSCGGTAAIPLDVRRDQPRYRLRRLMPKCSATT